MPQTLETEPCPVLHTAPSEDANKSTLLKRRNGLQLIFFEMYWETYNMSKILITIVVDISNKRSCNKIKYYARWILQES